MYILLIIINLLTLKTYNYETKKTFPPPSWPPQRFEDNTWRTTTMIQCLHPVHLRDLANQKRAVVVVTLNGCNRYGELIPEITASNVLNILEARKLKLWLAKYFSRVRQVLPPTEQLALSVTLQDAPPLPGLLEEYQPSLENMAFLLDL